MENQDPLVEVDALIRRIFLIESKSYGDPKKDYVLKYRGKLLDNDSAAAYDRLTAQLKPYDLTPLFRWEDGQHAILLIPGIPAPTPSNPRTNLIFLVLTLISIWITGGFISLETLPSSFGPALLALLKSGWPFALSMFAILGAHEFGHYLAGRAHGMNLTLPYFIPLPYPISPFGTMGAFINMKERPKNRRILLDVGIAGPLSGLIVAIPVLLLGLSLSKISVLPASADPNMIIQMEGNSLLYLLSKFVIFGRLLPDPASFNGVSPAFYWLRYFFTAHPIPWGATDVTLHPVAWAGWGGLLITSLNLIPAGQLDGGHLMYVLFGQEKARRILPVILVALMIMGIVWPGWWLWALIIFFLGRAYAEPLDQITPLDPRRKWLAVLGLVVFFLIFTPVPLSILY